TTRPGAWPRGSRNLLVRPSSSDSSHAARFGPEEVPGRSALHSFVVLKEDPARDPGRGRLAHEVAELVSFLWPFPRYRECTGALTGRQTEPNRERPNGCRAGSPGGSAQPTRRVEEVGTIPLGPPVGNGARGLQRQRRRLELLHSRSRPFPRVPVGRGRPLWDLRRQAAALLRSRPLERSGPHPEGATLRAHEQ